MKKMFCIITACILFSSPTLLFAQNNKYQQEVDRLNREIERRERELDQELKGMAAGSDDVYYFSSREYCKGVSAAVGGSYQIEQGCMMNEEDSKRNLENLPIPTRVIKYCETVSNSVGGSYQIMYGCVINELDAKESLR